MSKEYNNFKLYTRELAPDKYAPNEYKIAIATDELVIQAQQELAELGYIIWETHGMADDNFYMIVSRNIYIEDR